MTSVVLGLWSKEAIVMGFTFSVSAANNGTLVCACAAHLLLTYTRAAQAHERGEFHTRPARATNCAVGNGGSTVNHITLVDWVLEFWKERK